jgi:hypothetical protein
MFSLGGVLYRLDPVSGCLVKAAKAKVSEGQMSLFDAPADSSAGESGGSWEESKHPRDHGKFTSKGEGGKKPAEAKAKQAPEANISHAVGKQFTGYLKEFYDYGTPTQKDADEGMDVNHPAARWDSDTHSEFFEKYQNGGHKAVGEQVKKQLTEGRGDSESLWGFHTLLGRTSLNKANWNTVNQYTRSLQQNHAAPMPKAANPETQTLLEHLQEHFDDFGNPDDNDPEDIKSFHERIDKHFEKNGGMRRWFDRRINTRSYDLDGDLWESLSDHALKHVDWEQVGSHVSKTLKLPESAQYEQKTGKRGVYSK